MKQRIAELKNKIEEGRKWANTKRGACWSRQLKLATVETWRNSGMSQAKFSKEIGVSSTAFNSWVRGNNLGPHIDSKNKEVLRNEEEGSLKLQSIPVKQKQEKKEPSFLTFEVIDSPSEANIKHSPSCPEPQLFETIDLVKTSSSRNDVSILFPSGVRASIPPDHPDLLSMFQLFMNTNMGGV